MAKHLYKCVEWEGAPGCWLVNDTSDLSSEACMWWTPVRILNITPEEYVHMLINQFHVNKIHYTAEHNVLIFSFKTQAEARKYKNFINKKARECNFICGK